MLSKVTISKLFCVALVVAGVLVLNFAVANTDKSSEKKAVPNGFGPPYTAEGK